VCPTSPRIAQGSKRQGEYEDRASPVLWASALGVPLGVSLVILAFISAKSSNWNVHISDSQSIAQCLQWAQKLPLKQPFESPPAFALLAAPILVILIILFMVLLQPYPSKSLYVHLLTPSHPAGEVNPLAEPVIACVADAGPAVTPRVYVNSTASSWDELESALRDQLKLARTGSYTLKRSQMCHGPTPQLLWTPLKGCTQASSYSIWRVPSVGTPHAAGMKEQGLGLPKFVVDEIESVRLRQLRLTKSVNPEP
jgi:hypothetical protein